MSDAAPGRISFGIALSLAGAGARRRRLPIEPLEARRLLDALVPGPRAEHCIEGAVGGLGESVEYAFESSAGDGVSAGGNSEGGAEFRVNSFTPFDQTLPTVAMSPSGDFVVAWTSLFQDGSLDGIYAQRFDTAGQPQDEEFRVNTYTTGAQGKPSVAMDEEGNIIIAWSGEGEDDGYGIYAQRYDAAGVPQGTEFRANATIPAEQFDGDVACDAAGSFVIAWTSDGQDGSDGGVYAQRFDADGMPQGGEFRINQHTTDDQLLSDVAMDADGNFVVTWMSYGQDDVVSGVFARRYSADGTPRGDEFPVNTYTTGYQEVPAVAIDPDGDFVVAWESYNGPVQDGSGQGVYAQRYATDGMPQGGEFRANTHTLGNQNSTSIAIDQQGNFLITWQSDNQDGSSYGIYAQRYDSAGDPLGPEFRVNEHTASAQRSPAVAMDAAGNAVVVWRSLFQDGSQEGVYARRLPAPLPSPAVTESEFSFETLPQQLAFTFNQDVSASLGLDDILVEPVPGGPSIVPDALSYDSGTNTARFSFAAPLLDANFRATLLAAGISGPGGAMPSDHHFDFHFLRGDANGDGLVNLQDFNRLATNFGQPNRTFGQGDFNYDGTVNLQDFNILAIRFGTSLDPADDELIP